MTTATPTIPKHVTLAELNAHADAKASATARTRYFVGNAGSTRRGTTGSHGHVVSVMSFELHGEWREMATSVHGGKAVPTDGDTQSVTCSKCLAWLERATANIRGVK